jgi:hypothetical protein
MKVKIMETQGNQDMKELKRKIQPATNQQERQRQLQVDQRRHRHIMLLKNILVKEEDLIQQIRKKDMVEMTHKETAAVVADNQEVAAATPNQSTFPNEIVITIIIANLKIVTMVEIITRNLEMLKWIMKPDLSKRTAKMRTVAKVKKAMRVTKTAEETREAIMQIIHKIATKKLFQMRKELLELETECLKNLIQNKEKIFHLECL